MTHYYDQTQYLVRPSEKPVEAIAPGQGDIITEMQSEIERLNTKLAQATEALTAAYRDADVLAAFSEKWVSEMVDEDPHPVLRRLTFTDAEVDAAHARAIERVRQVT